MTAIFTFQTAAISLLGEHGVAWAIKTDGVSPLSIRYKPIPHHRESSIYAGLGLRGSQQSRMRVVHDAVQILQELFLQRKGMRLVVRILQEA